MNWKIAQPLLSLALTIIFIFIGFQYALSNSDNIEFKQPPWPIALSVALLFVFNTLVRSLFNRFILKQVGVVLSFRETFFLGMSTTMINMIVPAKAGLAVRALYLRKFYRLRVIHFASSTLAFDLSLVIGGSAMGMAGLIYCYWQFSTQSAAAWLIIGSIFFSATAIYLMGRSSLQPSVLKKPPVRDFFTNLKSSFRQHGLIPIAFLSSTLITVSAMVAFYVLAISLIEEPTPIGAAAVFASANNIAGIISITPGSVGIQELFSMLMSGATSINPYDVFVILVVWRFIRMITALSLGIPMGILLFYRNPNAGNPPKTSRRL